MHRIPKLDSTYVLYIPTNRTCSWIVLVSVLALAPFPIYVTFLQPPELNTMMYTYIGKATQS